MSPLTTGSPLVTDATLQYWVSNELVKTTLGYRIRQLRRFGRRIACGIVPARLDGHTLFLRKNPVWRNSERIRIDTDAILGPLAHAHYRR